MLKKLYKHEFYSLFRNLLPIYIGVIGLAIFSRLFFLLDERNYWIRVIQKSTMVLFVLGIIAMFVLGVIIVLRRFYNNLLSSEGYLTFTLPFKPSQHIICKLVCGMAVTVINFICVLLSLIILNAGKNLERIVDDLIATWDMMTNKAGTLKPTVCIIEIVILAIVTLAAAILMTYTAMSIGQQFKNRIAASVISYGVIYAIIQTIGVIIIAVISNISFDLPIDFDGIDGEILVSLAAIIYQLIYAAAYYVITRYFLSKKLNLA